MLRITFLPITTLLLAASCAAAAEQLPIFAPGQVECVFEHGLIVDGQVINQDGKAVSPMGSPQRRSICVRGPVDLANDGPCGFMPGANGISNRNDNCVYSALKVEGNSASFAVLCDSGSPAVQGTSGQVSHSFDAAQGLITQRFEGGNIYGKLVVAINTYRRAGECK